MPYSFMNCSPINSLVRNFIADTYDDIATINVAKILPGSTVFVIGTKKTYMLNHQNQWCDITMSCNGGGGGEDTPDSDANNLVGSAIVGTAQAG